MERIQATRFSFRRKGSKNKDKEARERDATFDFDYDTLTYLRSVYVYVHVRCRTGRASNRRWPLKTAIIGLPVQNYYTM